MLSISATMCIDRHSMKKMNKISNTKLLACKISLKVVLLSGYIFASAWYYKVILEICATSRINRFYCYFNIQNNDGNHHKLLTIYYEYLPIILSGIYIHSTKLQFSGKITTLSLFYNWGNWESEKITHIRKVKTI